MRYQNVKFTVLSSLLVLIFWFADSSIHHFIYGESHFEFIPSNFNELWMRLVIVCLVLALGAYADVSMKRLERISRQRNQLQVERDQMLTKLLSGYVSICAVCKKVKVQDNNIPHKTSWQSIESYISRRTDLEFSHGYCEECASMAMQSIYEENE